MADLSNFYFWRNGNPPALTMQTPTRLLCLLLWLGRLEFASAAQKAVRLEVGFDPGFNLINGTRDVNGKQLTSNPPSYSLAIGLGTPPQPLNATLVVMGPPALSVIDAQDMLWQMPCTNSGSLTMQFAGATGPEITIPFSDLLVELYDMDYKPQMLNGVRMCRPRLYPNDGPYLGTVFFNSAYVVFDYDQGQVSLAQGNRNISGSNVREIAAGPRGVPGVASTATGPLPSKFQLVVAATSSSLSPTHTPNGAVTGYLAAAMLYKVVAVMLVIAV